MDYRVKRGNEEIPRQVLVQVLHSYPGTFYVLFYVQPQAFDILCVDPLVVRVHKVFTIVVFSLLLDLTLTKVTDII